MEEEPANFESEVYVPHLTIMPDTVFPNDPFLVKASVYLANGCQVFDSLGINRGDRAIRLTYYKKEFQNDNFDCNSRETFILEKHRFSFSEVGNYEIAFMDKDENVVKKHAIHVTRDTPVQNFDWKLRLRNTSIPSSTLANLMVSYKKSLGPTIPGAPGVDTFFTKALNKINEDFYSFSVPEVIVDSNSLDSLSYTFRINSSGQMVDTFSTLTTENTIFKGRPEIIRKGPSPR